MSGSDAVAPEHTAARVALWRALHLEADPPPHVVRDEIGLRLVDPDDGWRERPDMDPDSTRPMRAGVVARARFIEDLIVEQSAAGVGQYVLLGAGLDTLAQRRPELASAITIFEVDQPGPQEWKRRRLDELGLAAPTGLRLVPVDFEAESWWERLVEAGFDPQRPAVVASTGVSMYLTHAANTATLQRISTLAPGSTLVMTYMLPIDRVGAPERMLREFAERGARSSGTPFISFYDPEQIRALALESGFRDARTVSGDDLTDRYFRGRPDGLRPAASEELLVAST
ncbi:class I SAM-dependent methyltransferase [Nocardia sp. CA2R105]|uniref:class I SAM-dependent methyltransferase n=1 Tax=Nocardia coffeae TaxID=2873381 RepID=UPI001CA6B9E5|nr:class I SAM-dependent methyltransferase [Nocardia coffeae]MBY8863242.1 class I SAM-dependent methyltransferase [Nocardia coffeae]